MRRSEEDYNELGNTFVTTTTPEGQAIRKAVANKRIFLLICFLCLAALALITWEIIDLIILLK